MKEKKTIAVSLFISIVSIALTTVQAKPRILSSIYPIQQIANAIAGEKTDVIVSGTRSPHTYQITPSDASAIDNVDIFVWVGPSLMPQADNHVDRRLAAKRSDQITLMVPELPNIELLDEDSEEEEHGPAADHKDEEGNHHHGEFAYNEHVWLSTHNAKVIARAIADSLIKLDSANAGEYQAHLATFVKAIEQTKAAIKKELQTHALRPYVVFHDAYGYFEAEFGIKHVGVITVHPGQSPKSKSMVELKKLIESTPNMCVFREPQFDSRVVKQLVAGTSASIAVLDPLGYTAPKKGYPAILSSIADQLVYCK